MIPAIITEGLGKNTFLFLKINPINKNKIIKHVDVIKLDECTRLENRIRIDK